MRMRINRNAIVRTVTAASCAMGVALACAMASAPSAAGTRAPSGGPYSKEAAHEPAAALRVPLPIDPTLTLGALNLGVTDPSGLGRMRSAYVDAGVILADFSPPTEAYGSGHRGIDPVAAPGQPVRTPAPGVITFAGSVAGKPVVVISHRDGTRTTLEPVTATIARNAAVAQGAQIGVVAPSQWSHCSTHCVHWGLRIEDDYLDPWRLVAPRVAVVLLE